MSLTLPSLWNSAHRPIVYRYDYVSYSFTSVITFGGLAGLYMTNPADTANFTAGQRIYIPSGTYQGNWTVTQVTSLYVYISAPFSVSESGTVKPMFNLTCEIWAGYEQLNLVGDTHPGYAENPIRKIADFTGIPGIAGYANIDVSTFVKSIFKNIKAVEVGADFNMSTPFALVIPSEPTENDIATATRRFAVNGTFEHAVLNSYDADHKILNAREPIHFTDGTCVYSMIWPDTSVNGEHIFNILGVDGQGLSNLGGVGFDAIGITFTVS